MTQKLVTIFGGTGQLGRLVVRRLARKGWRVRVALRRPDEGLFLRVSGTVGQIALVQANIRDEASIRRAVKGADAVVNCVGIIFEDGFQKFDEVNEEGAANIARIASEEGVRQLVHVSAEGARADAPSRYLQSKFAGETALLAHFRKAAIIRPALMCGFEGDIFCRFAGFAKYLPIIGIAGARASFAPVYIDNVAEAIERILQKKKYGTLELFGPQKMRMDEMAEMAVRLARRSPIILRLPHFAAVLLAWGLNIVELLSFGIIRNRLITPDQLKSLRDFEEEKRDGAAKNGFEALGMTPDAVEARIAPALIPYRKKGEFDELVKPRL